jgi:hypothetical protein
MVLAPQVHHRLKEPEMKKIQIHVIALCCKLTNMVNDKSEVLAPKVTGLAPKGQRQ